MLSRIDRFVFALKVAAISIVGLAIVWMLLISNSGSDFVTDDPKEATELLWHPEVDIPSSAGDIRVVTHFYLSIVQMKLDEDAFLEWCGDHELVAESIDADSEQIMGVLGEKCEELPAIFVNDGYYTSGTLDGNGSLWAVYNKPTCVTYIHYNTR